MGKPEIIPSCGLANCLVLFVSAVCWLAACAVPTPTRVQRYGYEVDGKPVSEEVYRAARFYNDALPLIEANRLTEAQVKLIAAVRLAPDFYEAHYNLGLVLSNLGKEQDALGHFRTVVAAKADLPDAWVSLSAIYVNGGKHHEAITVLTDALSRFPAATWQKFPEVYYNFGIALGQLGQTDEGIEKLKLAVELPVAWMSLGTFYQTSGKLQQSIDHFREFIKRAPSDPDVPIIIDTIKVLEAELRIADRIPVRSNEDYYAEITVTEPNTWSHLGMPLRVHIRSGDGIPGFEHRFTEILKAAFQDWVNAAGGKISIRFVDRPGDADIECMWTHNPGQLRNKAEGGEAQVYHQGGEIRKATITILTVPLNRTGSVTDNNIKSVALHEVGHVFGLLGHSPNPQDVMFFSARIRDEKPELSARDRRTVLRLYSRN